MTRWAAQVDPAKPLPEYPRPQMVRAKWVNLNGLWNYAITGRDTAAPLSYMGQILVPYPLESALSGVKKPVSPSQNLWYQRTFAAPALKQGERLLLHFGAVDFEATVFVNEQEVGKHSGGYQNFSFDVTGALKSGKNDLKVKVWDPTDEGPNPHGKQVLKPHGIMYTATSGIWQTVWLETVPAKSIDSLVLTPDVDNGALKIEVRSSGAAEGYAVAASAGQSSVRGAPNEVLSLKVPDPRLWSPADPHLYDLEVRLLKNGKAVDTVRSYFGMRKVELKKDAAGRQRIYLNNQYVYNLGVLDQGFWPDGLHTAPTDAALKSDVETIKSMGFNTIRKHIKREPARWYYHCDKLGMMVWQDMVQPGQATPAARAQFEKEMLGNLQQLHNYPSITTWVLFNEGWYDFDQERLESEIKRLDPSRLLNGHSGSTMLVHASSVNTVAAPGRASDMIDLHSYPDPGIMRIRNPELEAGNTEKALVLGEYGGVGVIVKDHIWIDIAARGWGYGHALAVEDLTARYGAMIDSLKKLEEQGLTGSIYTQPFDVESEQNGLVTYDREVMKIPVENLVRLHRGLTE